MRSITSPLMFTSPARAKPRSIYFGPGDLPQAVYSIGIKAADMRRIMSDVVHHRDIFLREWERIHGSAD
jgi:hypothetical protein